MGVPLRQENTEIRYCGRFYGQTTEGEPIEDAISVSAFLSILETLPDGITELCCHPGYADEAGHGEIATMYFNERSLELEVLCDSRVRDAVSAEGIELCSFARSAGDPTPMNIPRRD